MKKLLIVIIAILFFAQASQAVDQYIKKPKGEKDELPSGGDQINFMMLEQASEAMEDLNAYELTPPKKGKKEGKDKAEKDTLKQADKAISNPVEPEKTVKSEIKKSQLEKIKVVPQCPNCSATDHADDAKFCKFCGTKLK